MEESFCIHIVSNACKEIFPNNTSSNFSTILADEIQLNGSWEVGVKDIMYPTVVDSTTSKDKIYFYNMDIAKRFRFNRNELVKQVNKGNIKKLQYNGAEVDAFRLPLRFLRNEYEKDNVSTYPTKLLEGLNASEAGSYFHFEYLKSKKFKLTVKENLVVEMDGLSKQYFGFLNQFFSSAEHWAWRADHSRVYDKRMTHFVFFIYDLNSYDKITVPMKFEGDSFFNDDIGLNLQNGLIIPKPHVSNKMLFYNFDAETKEILRSKTNYTQPSIYNASAKYHFNKIDVNAFKKLKPTVTVWLRRVSVNLPQREELILQKSFKEHMSPPSMLTALNQNSNSHGYKFTFDKIEKRMNLNVGEKYSLLLSDSLQSILGFPQTSNLLFSSKVKGDYIPVFDRAMNILYIYSNIVEASYVGDVKAPLLLTCAFTKDAKNDIFEKEFLNPTFYPLNRQVIRQLDIGVYNEMGERVPFSFGKTSLTLCFRKRL